MGPGLDRATVSLWCLARIQQVLSSIFLSSYVDPSLVLWLREQALVWSFDFFSMSIGVPRFPASPAPRLECVVQKKIQGPATVNFLGP